MRRVRELRAARHTPASRPRARFGLEAIHWQSGPEDLACEYVTGLGLAYALRQSEKLTMPGAAVGDDAA
jgi:hypothetical protein